MLLLVSYLVRAWWEGRGDLVVIWWWCMVYGGRGVVTSSSFGGGPVLSPCRRLVVHGVTLWCAVGGAWCGGGLVLSPRRRHLVVGW